MSAILIVETLTMLADRNRWGQGAVVRDTEIGGAQNLYASGPMKDGVAMWALELKVKVRLAAPDPAAPGQLSALFFGTAPNIGPDHVADYVQLGGGDVGT